jgi:2-polyprenyl-6-methoxyphenol hydroxylase-like FAD-dependent oxidoreductase
MGVDTEVTIVGGGPAGLATAIALGRRGVRVAILDQQSLPADKVCGEGIMPPGLQFLEEVGANSLISTADKFPFAGIHYLSRGGHSAQAEFEAGPGRGIRRIALSAALREVATGMAGVTLHQGVRVTGVQRTEGQMNVHCADRDPVSSRLVVGADGLRSRVRRWAGLERGPARRQRFGVRQHLRLAPWSRFVEVHSGPDLEAYVTPCGPDCVGVAILWEPRRCPWAMTGDGLFPSLLETIPALHERLRGAEPASAPRSTGPFEQATSRRTTDGIALLGDASGYLDPCTGEGLTLAFRQALALEASVVPALERHPSGVLRVRSLRGYERNWRKIMRPYFLSTRAMLFCHRHPALFERLIKFGAHRPDLLRHLFSFNMGTGPLLPSVGRAARWFLAPAPHAENP